MTGTRSPEPGARIYLDNAATSWPKPESVYQAVTRFAREMGGSAGRGGHGAAVDAQAIVEQTRRAVAGLLNAETPSSVALLFNGTDALNAAIHGVLRAGDHVVTTVCEHNSVLRPLRDAQERLGCEVTRVGCADDGVTPAQSVLAAIRDDTRLVAMTHASNVMGTIQPVEEVCRATALLPTLVLVDAAQTVGHLPIDVAEMGVDLLAASGHKGLLGPTGTGLLYVRPGVEAELRPLRQGGTGSHSDVDRQPESMPALLESGNPNVLGLAGLREGIAYLNEQGLESLHELGRRLTARLIDGLGSVPGCRLYGSTVGPPRLAVVSVNFAGYDPHEAAAVLESIASIQCRAGLHCAPAMHRRLGTLDGGTVRFSPGCFNTMEQIDRVIAAAQALSS